MRDDDWQLAIATIWFVLWQIGGEVAIWSFGYRFGVATDGVLMNMGMGSLMMLLVALLSGFTLAMLFSGIAAIIRVVGYLRDGF